MVERIASKIIEAYDEGEKIDKETGKKLGQDKYKAYFINTRLYLRYKADVDNILTLDGYGDCIVTE